MTCFIERAKAIQPYDVGPGGRFWSSRSRSTSFSITRTAWARSSSTASTAAQQHDVYMQGFLVYGWLGGAAYLTMVVVTLAVGLRASLIRRPWQTYLVAAYATFVGEAFEGFIVDTDHWRHFFLILGVIWGLTAASINLRRAQRQEIELDGDAVALPA